MLDIGCPLFRNFSSLEKEKDPLVQNQLWCKTPQSFWSSLHQVSQKVFQARIAFLSPPFFVSSPKDSKSDPNGKLGKLESFHSILASPHHALPASSCRTPISSLTLRAASLSQEIPANLGTKTGRKRNSLSGLKIIEISQGRLQNSFWNANFKWKFLFSPDPHLCDFPLPATATKQLHAASLQTEVWPLDRDVLCCNVLEYVSAWELEIYLLNCLAHSACPGGILGRTCRVFFTPPWCITRQKVISV